MQKLMTKWKTDYATLSTSLKIYFPMNSLENKRSMDHGYGDKLA